MYGKISDSEDDRPEIYCCQVLNVNPDNGERDRAVPYKVLMKFRSGLNTKGKLAPFVGCNAVPAGEGIVRVGDVVHIKV